MQLAGPAIIVQPIRGIRLLLSLDDHRARTQSVYGSTRNVDHVAGVDVDPIQQLFCGPCVNRLFQLSHGDARLQSQGDLRSGPGMGNVPAFRLAPWLAHAERLLVIGMNLNRKLLVREKKLEQQRKPLGIARCLTNHVTLVFVAQLRKSPSLKPSVGYLAVIASQPGLADLLVELVIRINRRQIVRAPRARIKPGERQQWIERFKDKRTTPISPENTGG